MEESAIERLQAKSPEEAIIERISRDYNLAPFMARTQFEQMRLYFEEYFGLERDIGQMTVLALSTENPPGRPIAECKRVPINLTMDSSDDLEASREGVAALRRRGNCSEGLVRECARLGTTQPSFEVAAGTLERLGRISLSASTVWRYHKEVTDQLEKELEEEQKPPPRTSCPGA
jgi:hypothetical protein